MSDGGWKVGLTVSRQIRQVRGDQWVRGLRGG